MAVASWLDGGSSSSSSKIAALQLNTAVVAEMIEVLILLSNPLAVDLQISRLRLLFEPEPMSEDMDLTQYAEARAPNPSSLEHLAHCSCLVNVYYLHLKGSADEFGALPHFCPRNQLQSLIFWRI